MKHAWLCVDPGIATGWALLDDDGKLLGTGVWGTLELEKSLDLAIRYIHTHGIEITLVMTQARGVGSSALERKVEAVRKTVLMTARDVYELPVITVPTRAWRELRERVPGRHQGIPLTPLQKKAVRMGRYAQEVQNVR